MKRFLSSILTVVLLASAVNAEPTWPITKNVATRVCGNIMNVTTAKLIGAAPTGLDCEIDAWTDGASSDGYSDLGTAEVTVGTTGAFCAILTQSEANIDYATIKCTATNTNAADWLVNLTSKKVDVRDGGITALSAAFDGVTLAEGTNTIDLEASELSVDNQFRGDKLWLFTTSTGKYIGSSCIVSSTNANERVTTEEDLSSLHTVGDSYIVRPDSACYITASKIQADALGASEIATDAIGAAELAANSITSSEVADDSIDAGALATDAITATEIAASAIGTSELATGAITTAEFAAGAIDAAAIATDAIGAAELAADSIASSELAASALAEINAEVVDALNVDTYAELAACPTATASFKTMLQYLYMMSRNVVTQTATTKLLKKDDGTTTLCTYATSDDGTTFTKGEGS